MDPTQLSDAALFEALRKARHRVSTTGQRVPRESHADERLRTWRDEVIPLKEEVWRRHPPAIPADILKGKLPPDILALARMPAYASAGAMTHTRRGRSQLACSLLDMHNAKTAEEMEAADRRLSPGARRMWCLLQPEYEGFGIFDDLDR